MLTTREVASKCRVTSDTVRRWRREGRLIPAGRVPKGYLYREADVERFMVLPEPSVSVARDQLNAILSRRTA